MQLIQRCECLERIATFERDEVIEAFADKITGNILSNKNLTPVQILSVVDSLVRLEQQKYSISASHWNTLDFMLARNDTFYLQSDPSIIALMLALVLRVPRRLDLFDIFEKSQMHL